MAVSEHAGKQPKEMGVFMLRRNRFWRHGIWLCTFTLVVFLAACSSGNEHDRDQQTSDHQSDHRQLTLEPTVPVEVEVLTEPETIKAGEEVRIMAKVTQGDELVDDAERVKFELWKDGQNEDEHVHMDGEPQGNGIYAITYTFEEPGTYYVIPHTDARGMHTMPTATLQVGE
nr:hypothetical protein [Bacillota bacterium]